MFEVQNEVLVIYVEKFSKEEVCIDWFFFVVQLECCICVFNLWLMSWLEIDGQLVKVWQVFVIEDVMQLLLGIILVVMKQGIQVVIGKGILNLFLFQFVGKKVMSVQDLLNLCWEWFISGNCFV